MKSREQGRGPAHTEKFATLKEASNYIKERWQGADYVDGYDGFHTDYCTYELVGFTLTDIGRFYFIDDDVREFKFKTDDGLIPGFDPPFTEQEIAAGVHLHDGADRGL